ncbi:MAG: iron complex outermembrane receptor protein [Saprospiraceae bacterium]|jgi:iron complex outermembrane receptor protein
MWYKVDIFVRRQSLILVMRKVVIVLSVLICHLAYSQSIEIVGDVIDQSDQQPIEYASISVHHLSDSSLISGTVSEVSGRFELTFDADEAFYVAIQFIGYSLHYSEPLMGEKRYDLGVIKLGISSTTLQGIEIVGKEVTSMHKIDKQVYDAGQFQNAKGGTASDVLGNLPSISINSFGGISVRGVTGFMVMINGKPVQGDPSIILQQLSANTIEDIEVVTAPSAKYDPDGNAGIINIKTKKAVTDGSYLVANVLMGLPSIERYQNTERASRYGADITYNYQEGKWNLSIGADYRRYDRSGRREGYVNTYLDDVLTEFPSDGERSFNEINYSARVGVSYAPSANQSINAGLYVGKRTKDRTADILYLDQQRRSIPQSDFLSTGEYYERYKQSGDVFPNGALINKLSYFNKNLRVRKSDFIIGSLDYAHTFSNDAQLKISGLYERTVLGGPTDNVNLEYPNTEDIIELQLNDNDNPLDGYRFQFDYNQNIGEVKWESGYQYRYLSHPGDFFYFDRDLVNDVWVENPLFTNSIRLTRAIHSLYSQVSGSQSKLQYTVGLRLEHFDRNVEIARPDENFELSKWNLFPSLNLGYELGEGLKLKAGYSKRIERTTTFKMTPFPEREHSETLEQGDASLLPEYIDLVELGIIKSWGDNSVFATTYYRHTENVINRVNTIFNDVILNRIYTNAGSGNAYGLELGTTFYPARKWRLYFGGNVYNYSIEGDLFGEAINTSSVIYSINANTNYNFTSSFSGQLAFNYLSERVTAQGSDSQFYNPSLSLRKTFMDKKVSVALQWLNIDMGLWNSNEQRITTERNNFFTTTNYVYEVDIIQLSFTYQLNQPSKKVNVPQSEFGKKEF